MAAQSFRFHIKEWQAYHKLTTSLYNKVINDDMETWLSNLDNLICLIYLQITA